MKFGTFLFQQQFPPWRTEYLQYDRIKEIIKEKNNHDKVDQWLQVEFDKIRHFSLHQLDKLNQQLILLEKSSSSLLLDDLLYPLYDTHELERYIYLSIIGFQKLAKSLAKHQTNNDVGKTGAQIPDWLIILNQYHDKLDPLLMRLASLKEVCTSGHQGKKKSKRIKTKGLPPLPNENTSCYHSYSYWLHPNHVFELKAILLFYSSLIDHHPFSIVYLDNPQWDVYHQQLSAPFLTSDSIHISWKGSGTSDSQVQVNHVAVQESHSKVLHQLSLPRSTVGALFQQQQQQNKDLQNEDDILDQDFYNNNNSSTMALIVEPRKKKKQPPPLPSKLGMTNGKDDSIYQQIQQRIQQQKWQPRIKCMVQRTTYEASFKNGVNDSNKVFLHIDTKITMNVEQSNNHRSSSPGFSVLTVVVQCQQKCQEKNSDDNGKFGPDAAPNVLPDWLMTLINGASWIHPVPRFSLYVHGVSCLYREFIPLLPWWLSSFDTTWQHDNEDSHGSPAKNNDFGLSRSTTLQPLLHGTLPPWYSHMVMTIDNNDEKEKNILDKHVTTAKKWKKIKVEPKVFFANERTFLSWMQFCALLLTVSLNMINFGGSDDNVSRICGGLFIILTIIMALYALAKYECRAWQLVTSSNRYRFDDMYGPAVLCFLLILAMLINLGLRLTTPSH
ncbi:uncharacterized protein BX664DRAFT_385956 [Halteromyces radiatus]|uniref:uncharacterized protein n=1 Tax=Halteromyces radiatus TaxID=101107 RepID=UPI00221EB6D8|nr:uncharacterized protein BX664DRAFT_385956 [Halteromyces radiatus]KAI8089474.1 hypothetical protein BX664DRAFT_385956 [Halteromyces radiatus]